MKERVVLNRIKEFRRDFTFNSYCELKELFSFISKNAIQPQEGSVLCELIRFFSEVIEYLEQSGKREGVSHQQIIQILSLSGKGGEQSNS